VEIYLTVKLHWFFCLRLGFVPASFFFTQKRGRQQAFASLFASYAAILFYVLSQKSPLKPFKASIINSASAN
jgi:hypothetical protein